MDTRTKKDFTTQPDGPELGIELAGYAAAGPHDPMVLRWSGFRVSPAWRWGQPLVLGGRFFDGR